MKTIITYSITIFSALVVGFLIGHSVERQPQLPPSLNANGVVASDAKKGDDKFYENSLRAREEANQKFLEMSGKWESLNGLVLANWNYREIDFSASGDWKELDDKVFLLTEGLSFVTKDAHYTISFLDTNKDEIGLSRKDRKSEETVVIKMNRKRQS